MDLEDVLNLLHHILSVLIPEKIKEQSIFIEVRDQRLYDPEAKGYLLWINSKMIEEPKLVEVRDIIRKRGYTMEPKQPKHKDYYMISEPHPLPQKQT